MVPGAPVVVSLRPRAARSCRLALALAAAPVVVLSGCAGLPLRAAPVPVPSAHAAGDVPADAGAALDRLFADDARNEQALDPLGGLERGEAVSAERFGLLFTPEHARRGIVCVDDEWGRRLVGMRPDAVTVSAEVTPAGADTATRRYFQVPVVVSDKGVRAMAMPAAVPAPSTGLTVNLDYSNQLSSNAAIVTAAQGFLSAMLTGDGDVTRFTSPGTNLGAITPAPYASISVIGARTQKSLGDSAETPADGQRARLLLTISQQPPGTASSTDALTGAYALTMAARAGRWEVSALDPAPAAGVNGSDVASSLAGEEDENTDTPTGAETSAPASSEPTSDSGRGGGDDEAGSDDVLPTVTSEPSTPRGSTSAPTSTPSSGGGGGSLLGPGGIDLGPR